MQVGAESQGQDFAVDHFVDADHEDPSLDVPTSAAGARTDFLVPEVNQQIGPACADPDYMGGSAFADLLGLVALGLVHAFEPLLDE